MGYGKLYDRQLFVKTDKENNYEVQFTCYTQDTTHGFRHICTLGYNNTKDSRLIKDDIVAKTAYLNRTWEKYKYQTVLRSAVRKLDIDENIKENLLAKI